MGLLDHFYEREPKATEPKKPAPALNTSIRPSAMPTTPSPVAAAPRTVVNAGKFNEHFARMFSAMNLPGPDYYEWCKGEEAVMGQVLDADARRAMVYAMLKTQGLTRATLLESAAKYRAAVDADINTYDQAVAAKEAKVLAPKRAALSEAKASIQQELAEIDRLQKGIASRENTIAQLELELRTEESNLEGAKALYLAARDTALGKIDQDVAYITNTIKE